MNKRYLGAIILSPLLVFLFLGGFYLKYFILLLSLGGMYELYKVVKQKNVNAIQLVGYILCVLYYLILNNNMDFKFVLLLVSIGLFIALCIPVINTKYNFIDIAVTLFSFLYVAVFFSFIVLIDNKLNGNYLIWLVFISSWMCDTTAYYTGRAFGKTKLCPEVSPKKTVEGSIGGLLGSTLICGLFGFFIKNQGVNIYIYHYFIIGLICGVFCQFGDLVASSIKRYVGVKDYSNLIPGHGGILDRFDSILFASVVVYSYLTLVVGI